MHDLNMPRILVQKIPAQATQSEQLAVTGKPEMKEAVLAIFTKRGEPLVFPLVCVPPLPLCPAPLLRIE